MSKSTESNRGQNFESEEEVPVKQVSNECVERDSPKFGEEILEEENTLIVEDNLRNVPSPFKSARSLNKK